MKRVLGIALLLVPLSYSLGGCAEGRFDLGHDGLGGGGGVSLPIFGEPRWIEAITSETNQDDATMTEDGLELYFASKRETGVGREDIWVTRRASPDAGWGEAVLASVVNSGERETAPAISPDGLALWFSSDRDGTRGELDVWLATRATRADEFGIPVHLDVFATAENDLVRAPNASLTFLPRSSLSAENGNDLSLVPLGEGLSYGEAVALDELNTEADETDPTLSADGLIMVFASDRDDEDGDLYLARRGNLDEPFSAPIRLDELNSDEEESDPWLSGDGKTLLFSSRRSGQLEVYVAESLP